MAYTIVFYNRKGGSGKTNSAVNTAATLAHRKYQVLLIDNDHQGDASFNLGFGEMAENISGIYNQSLHSLPIYEVPSAKNLFICPGSENLEKIGYDLHQGNEADRIASYMLLKNALEPVKKRFDFIIIDTPPSSISPILYNSLVACDGVISPVDCDGPNAMRAIMTVIPFISELQVNGLNHNLEFLGVLLNKYSEDGSSKQVESEVLSWISGRKELRFNTKIWDYKKFKRAQWDNKAVISYDPSSEAAENFIELTKELIKKIKS